MPELCKLNGRGSSVCQRPNVHCEYPRCTGSAEPDDAAGGSIRPPILTAEEARALKPAWDPASVLPRIDALVRKVAPTHSSVDLPMDLLPDNGMGKFACGMSNLHVAGLKAALLDAGYRIETNGGGHSGRGYVRVSW